MPKFIEKFTLPDKEMERVLILERMGQNGGPYGYIDNTYPCDIFTKIDLHELDFEDITILYGGNGSGKSTLLNLIANKLGVKRIAPFNNSELFTSYVEACETRFGFDDEGFQYKYVPHDSRIITSDDVFDYMLAVRTNNEDIAEKSEYLHDERYKELKYGETVRFNGLDDYEEVREQVLARRKTLSRRQFIYKIAGKEVKLNSNGETAIEYFDKRLKDECLYCLDEPENSLSPVMQQELVRIIERKARYNGCQFIIATHSPFVLSLAGAKIYDLDATPCTLKKWWELENTKTYFEFFNSHKDLFLKGKE